MTEALIFSGIQPTGNIHLGNYLGAIQNWKKLSVQTKSLFCIVDQHAITVHQNPMELRQAIYEVTATFVACGIDPRKSPIFIQSSVPHHTQLAWILICNTPLGWLHRMTQFKEKSGDIHKEQLSCGLFVYPLLMAADILLYQTTHVPVGEDQKQHIELARDIAQKMNHLYQKDIFVLPEPLIQDLGARIMSLRDGKKKMSKSETSNYSRIHLKDTSDEIFQKIQKAKTDSQPFPSSLEELPNRPEIQNLLTIYVAIVNMSLEGAIKNFAGLSLATFKKELAQELVNHLSPIQKNLLQILPDQTYLDQILQEGCAFAKERSEKNLSKIYEMIGFLKF